MNLTRKHKIYTVLVICSMTSIFVCLQRFHLALLVNVENTSKPASSKVGHANVLGNSSIEPEKRAEEYRPLTENEESGKLNKKLPDIIGIGVKKCGTGALVRFLNLHPMVAIPRRVETNFFSRDFSKGMQFYLNLMPAVGENEHVMEKTPAYFHSVPTVPHRIKSTLPRAKLILSVCDPVLRAYSDYFHDISRGVKVEKNATDAAEEFDTFTKSFLETIAQPNKSLEGVARLVQSFCVSSGRKFRACKFSHGIYHYFLAEWRKLYNDSQLLVINGDNWLTDPGRTMEKVQKFIGIPGFLRREDFVRSKETGYYCLKQRQDNEIGQKRNELASELIEEDGLFCLGPLKGRTRNGVRPLYNSTYERLRNFYKPHNEKLYKMLGQNFGW